MLYDTIEIKPMLNGEWEVFHYPRKWGKKKAFEDLRGKMIEERLKVIAELQRQVDQLRALTL